MVTAFPIHPASQCPLCGSDNRCAMEIERTTGERQSACWCVGEHFPADLLTAMPAEVQGKACICMDCLRAATAREST